MFSAKRVHKLHSSDGISLLEVMLAIAIVVISLTALVAIANTATRNVAISRAHTVADQHVRAGVESIRHLRDNEHWQGLLTADGTAAALTVGQSRYHSLNAAGVLTAQSLSGTITQPCAQAAVPTATYQIETGYYRVVRISLVSSDEARVTVTVCYSYRGTTHQKVSAETLLTNWR